jgi:hypothetical protein
MCGRTTVLTSGVERLNVYLIIQFVNIPILSNSARPLGRMDFITKESSNSSIPNYVFHSGADERFVWHYFSISACVATIEHH